MLVAALAGARDLASRTADYFGRSLPTAMASALVQASARGADAGPDLVAPRSPLAAPESTRPSSAVSCAAAPATIRAPPRSWRMGRRALVRLAAAAVAAAIGLVGCGGSTYRLDRGIDRAGISTADTGRHRALLAEGDRLWAQRADPARLAAALARWEAAVDIKDDDWQTYARLARGYFFQADAVFAFQASGGTYPYHGGSSVDPAARKRHQDALRRGSRAALRGMAARSRDFEMRLSPHRHGPGGARVRHDAAGLVYWYVANWAPGRAPPGCARSLRSRGAILGCVHHHAASIRATSTAAPIACSASTTPPRPG